MKTVKSIFGLLLFLEISVVVQGQDQCDTSLDCCFGSPICAEIDGVKQCVSCTEAGGDLGDSECAFLRDDNPNAKCNSFSGRCYDSVKSTKCISSTSCGEDQVCDQETYLCVPKPVQEEGEEEEEEEESGPQTCTDHNQCESRYTPYCGKSKDSDGEKICMACNDEDILASDGDSDGLDLDTDDRDSDVCKAVYSDKPVCNTEGHCTVDLSAQVTAAENVNKDAETKSPETLSTEIDNVVESAFVDLPNEDTKKIMNNLVASVQSNLTNKNNLTTAGTKTTASTLKTLTAQADYMDESAIETASDAVSTVLTAALEDDSTIELDEATVITIVETLSNTVVGAEIATEGNDEKRAEQLDKVDANVAKISQAAIKNVDVGASVVVSTPQIKVTVTKFKPDELNGVATCAGVEEAEDNDEETTDKDDADDADDKDNTLVEEEEEEEPELEKSAGCVKISKAAQKVLENCQSNSGLQNVSKSYNTNVDGKANGTVSDNTQEINLLCGTEAQKVEDLDDDDRIEFVLTSTLDVTDKSCYWWSVEDKEWTNTGCEGTIIDKNTLSCKCTHLTSFAVVVPDPIKPEEEEDDTNNTTDDDDDDDEDKSARVTAMIVLFVLFVIVIIAGVLYTVLKDRKAKEKEPTTPYGESVGSRV